MQTPFFERKWLAAQGIWTSGEPARVAARIGVRWLVVDEAHSDHFASDLAAGRARIAYRAGPLHVIEVVGPVADVAPDDYSSPLPPLTPGAP